VPAAVEHITPVLLPTSAAVRPLLICGPSGVGKGTLLTRLLADYPHVFGRSVSHTTRKPRVGEVNGEHYHFVSVETLLADVKAGKFVEHANVHGNYYGTSIAAIHTVQSGGKICLLEVDIQGVQSIRRAQLDPLCYFIRAPSFEDLEQRLVGRGSESPESLQKRLDTAREEMDFFYTNRRIFAHELINNDVDASYKQLVTDLKHSYPGIKW